MQLVLEVQVVEELLTTSSNGAAGANTANTGGDGGGSSCTACRWFTEDLV